MNRLSLPKRAADRPSSCCGIRWVSRAVYRAFRGIGRGNVLWHGGGAILLALLLIPMIAQAAPSSERATLFDNVTLVPMDRERAVPHQAVLIQRGVIARVGPASSMAVPRGARRIDGRGAYLMPGLADMHVHLFSRDELLSYLAHGVTTVANMDGGAMHLRWRKMVAEGRLDGPTVYTAGHTMDGYPPLNPMFVTLEDPAAARQNVARMKRDGYDFLKVYGTLNPDVYTAIMDEARKQRIAVTGHIVRQVGAKAFIEGYPAQVAHAEEYLFTWFKDGLDPAKIADAARTTARAGKYVTANLTVYPRVIREMTELDRVLAEPEARYGSPAAYSQWMRSNSRYAREPNAREYIAWLRPRHAFLYQLTKALQNAGVRLLVGSDSAVIGFPGQSAHLELREMVRAGLTPYQALVAATRNAGAFVAQHLHRNTRFGTVAVGKRADLLLVEADPLASVENVSHLRGVMARGRWYDRATLQRLRDRVARDYPALRRGIERFDRLVDGGHLREGLHVLRRTRRRYGQRELVSQWVLAMKGESAFARDPAGSIALRKESARMYPDHFAVYNEIGIGYYRQGDRARAKRYFARSLAICPGNAVARGYLDRIVALERPPVFEPAGEYSFTTTVPADNGRRDARLTLRLRRAKRGYTGSVSGFQGADMRVTEVLAGRNRMWVSAAGRGGGTIELRLALKEDSVTGTWVAGFENNGKLAGRREVRQETR